MRQNERRAFVRGLLEAGRSTFDIWSICKDRGEKKSTIYNLIRALGERNHADRAPGSGRKRTVRTPGLIQVVHERIRRNPRISKQGGRFEG
jgi:hypothetical protein